MSRNFEANLSRSSSGKHHVAKRKNLHPHVRDSVSGKNLKASHLLSVNQNRDVSALKIQANTTLSSSAISTNGSVDFNIRPIDIVATDLYLEYDVTNGDTGSYEVQTLTFSAASGSAWTGQTFLMYEGEVSAPFLEDAAGAAAVTAIANAMTNVTAAGGVDIALTSGTIADGDAVYTITFRSYGPKSMFYAYSTCTETTSGFGLEIVSAQSTASTLGAKFASYSNIDRADFFNNKNSSVEYSIDRDAIMVANTFHDSDEAVRMRKLQNLTSAYVPNNALLPGASDTYYVRIPNPFTDQCHMPLDTIGSEIRCRIHFSSNGIHSGDATVSELTISNCNLWLYGEALGDSEHEAIRRNLSGEHSYRVLDIRKHDIQQSFASNTEYDLQLDGVNGTVAFAFVLLRENNGDGSSMHSDAWQPISQLELIDRSGRTSVNQISSEENRLLMSGSNFPNQDLITEKNIYPICFASDVRGALEGEMTGYYEMNGERLKFTTGTLANPGNHTLSFIYYVYSFLDVDKNGDYHTSK